MSAPSGNADNSMLGNLASSAQNAVNYVSESVQGAVAGSQKEANKEQAKGNVPGKDSMTDRLSGGLNAASNKIDETTHDTSASANKQSI